MQTLRENRFFPSKIALFLMSQTRLRQRKQAEIHRENIWELHFLLLMKSQSSEIEEGMALWISKQSNSHLQISWAKEQLMKRCSADSQAFKQTPHLEPNSSNGGNTLFLKHDLGRNSMMHDSPGQSGNSRRSKVMPEMLGPGAGHIRAVEQKSIFKRENPIRGIRPYKDVRGGFDRKGNRRNGRREIRKWVSKPRGNDPTAILNELWNSIWLRHMFRRIRQHRKPRIIPEIPHKGGLPFPMIHWECSCMSLRESLRPGQMEDIFKETLEVKWLMLNLVFKNELPNSNSRYIMP